MGEFSDSRAFAVLRAGVASAALALAGCAPILEDMGYVRANTPMVSVEADDPAPVDESWDAIVSSEDRTRIARTDEAWELGLALARQARFTSAIESEGALLDPLGALPSADPTPGSYRCRLVKLGAAEAGDPKFQAYSPFFCYIDLEGDRFTIVKQTGTQRPAGRLYAQGDRSLVYLGSLALGSEREPLAYGDDPERDMAGLFERVGPFRWRLVIPFPRNGGTLDVIELTPSVDQPG